MLAFEFGAIQNQIAVFRRTYEQAASFEKKQLFFASQVMTYQ